MMRTQIVDISRVVTGTPSEPVTLAQAKTHCRVDFTDDDAYITTLITQCRRAIENYCQISIVPYTVTLTVNYWTNEVPYIRGPGQGISAPYDPVLIGPSFELPFGPVASSPAITVTSIGQDNSSNTLDPNGPDYYIRGASFKTLQIVNTVFGNSVVVYPTGYTTVPDDLVLALLNELAFRYEARGDTTNRYAAQNVAISEGSQYLSNPYKRFAWL